MPKEPKQEFFWGNPLLSPNWKTEESGSARTKRLAMKRKKEPDKKGPPLVAHWYFSRVNTRPFLNPFLKIMFIIYVFVK